MVSKLTTCSYSQTLSTASELRTDKEVSKISRRIKMVLIHDFKIHTSLPRFASLNVDIKQKRVVRLFHAWPLIVVLG